MICSRNAIGNLINRYRAVLKKCAFLNAMVLMSVAIAMPASAGGFEAIAKIGEKGYATLQEAFTAVQNGETINLVSNVKHGTGVQLSTNTPGKTFSFNLNGKTYSAYQDPTGSEGTKNQLFQLLKNNNVTFTNGTLQDTSDNKEFRFLIQNYSDLTLDGMMLDGTNLQFDSKTPYTLSNNYGTVIIKNSKIIGPEKGFAFDVYDDDENSYPGGTTVMVTGSEIRGNIEVGDKSSNSTGDAKLTLENTEIFGSITNLNKGIVTAEKTTFKDGKAANGGAIHNENTLSIKECTFEGNTSSGEGGAIQSKGTCIIKNSTFKGNESQSYGGAVKSTSTDNVKTSGYLTIESSTFEGNKAQAAGAVVDGTKNKLTIITGSTFKGNEAKGIGALGLFKKATVSDSKFIENHAKVKDHEDNGAGAIFLGSESQSTLTKLTFDGNTSASVGGAIATRDNKQGNHKDAQLSIAGSTFKGNEAGTDGGAIWNTFYHGIANGAPVTVAGSTFTMNKAKDGGGAIFNGDRSKLLDNGNKAADLRLTGTSSFTENTAGKDGGAIFNTAKSQLTIADTATFTGNTAGQNGGAIYNEGTITLSGKATFSGNSSSTGKSQDIYNKGGTITIDNGADVVLGEYNTGTLDNHQYAYEACGEGKIEIKGGSLTADFRNFLDYKGDNVKINKADVAGIIEETDNGGTFNLRSQNIFVNNTYTLKQLLDAKKALFADDNDIKTNLAFLNASLGDIADPTDPSKERAIVAKIDSGDDCEAVIKLAEAAEISGGQLNPLAPIPDTGTNFVKVVDNTGTMRDDLKAITAEGSQFKAPALQVASESIEKVTLTEGSNLGFTGKSLVVDRDETPLKTSAVLKGENNTLTIFGDMSDNLTKVEVGGDKNTLALSGGTAKIKAIVTNGKDNRISMQGGASLNAENITIGERGIIQVGDSSAKGGDTLTVKNLSLANAYLLVDPAWGQPASKVAVENFVGASSATDIKFTSGRAGVGQNSMLAFGSADTSWLEGQIDEVGGLDQNGITAAFGLQKRLTLADTAAVLVNGSLTDADNALHNAVSDADAGSATFADKSLLVVNGDIAGTVKDQAAIQAAKVTVGNDAKLRVTNVKSIRKYYVANADSLGISGDSWNGANLSIDNKLLTAMLNKDAKSAWITFGLSQNAMPRMDPDLFRTVQNLVSKDPDCYSGNTAAQFVNRAASWLSADDAAAAIEGAAKLAFTAAVPQVTMDMAKAADNAVASRDFYSATPGTGVGADDAGNGFNLWAMPTYQHKQASGFKSGNFRHGYKADLGGMAIGADQTIDNLRYGVSLNGGGGKTVSSGSFSRTWNDVNFFGVNLYGSYKMGDFSLSANLGYLQTGNDVKQDTPSVLGMGQNKADIKGRDYTASIRGAWNIETPYLDVVPHAGVQFHHVRTGAFGLKNGGQTIISGEKSKTNIVQLPVGVTLKKTIVDNGGWNVRGALDLTAVPTCGSRKANQTVRLTGADFGAGIDHTITDSFTGRATLGVEATKGRLGLGLNYSLEAGSHTRDHGVQATLSWKF